ncbi:hypothetical protein ABMA27_005445 [Loxostege sticticalis]|uniref:RNase H type-1 domain-containing protein n=1 Tax=Loxostege sticticalis TaxID=481309 RepID=A0ABR3HJ86_LOXSC
MGKLICYLRFRCWSHRRQLHDHATSATLSDLPGDITLRQKVPVKQLLHPAERVSIEFDEAHTQEDIDRITRDSPIVIFTDGSKLDGGEVGSAAVIHLPDGSIICHKRKLGRTSPVFVAELTAIDVGLKWLYGSRWTQELTVATDSVSSLKALQDRSNTDPTVASIHSVLKDLRENRGISARFTWVKAHCGIAGNEQADQAAKLAAAQKTATTCNEFPISYAKYLIRQRTQERWQKDYEAETALSEISSWFSSVSEIREFRKHFGATFQSTQIFTGHGYNKHYLNRFKIIDNESCPCDDISVQDTKHLMQHCPIFANVRFNHEMTCKNLKVNPYKVMELITKEEPKETFVTLINTIVNRLKQINKT